MKHLLIIAFLATVALLGWQFPVQRDTDLSEYDNKIQDLISSYAELSQRNLGDATLPIAGMTYSLYSGISSSATSLTLSSLTIPQSGYSILDSDLSSTFYITIEPGNRSRQEIISCTTVTQNSGGTATLSGCTRGLAPISPYTASSTLQFSHAGGASVIFSDPPQLFNQYTAKDNSETITGLWTYNTVLPTSSLTATTSSQFTIKSYVDSVVNQGAATSTESVGGISQLATQLQMASSTDLGSNIPLVLQAKYATSSCQTVGLYSLVTANNGKLSLSACGDLSQNLTWTGTQTWSGLTTFSATSTMATTTIAKLTTTNVAYVASTTVFTATGTWVRPASVDYVDVEVVGGGGGGGGVNVTGDCAAGGGGAGGYARARVSVTGNVTVTIGASGAGAVSNGSAGTGGNSSFAGATTITSNGGTGGSSCSNDNEGTAGGAGGSTTNAQLGLSGQSGARGNPGVNMPTGGVGGSSPLGFGGQGGVGSSNEGGSAGSGYGSGGGGAARNTTGTANGGAGTAGVVIVKFLIPAE